MSYPENDHSEYNARYAQHLEEMMEAQYWDEMEALAEQQRIDELMKDQIDPHDLLHVPMGANDVKAATVGEYLGLLLSTLWIEKEGFSGKRPFGNSDWDYQVYIAMGKAGMIEIELDEDGYVESFSYEEENKADELILQAIKLMYNHE